MARDMTNTLWDDADDWLEMPPDGSRAERVLVAVVTRSCDWDAVRRERWYRIPLARAPRRLGAEYLAFYHTKGLGDLRWTIRYYAPILGYRLARRRELLPDEADHPRADALYYKIEIGPLHELPRPIPSRRLRRVTFIMTSLSRLLRAREVNDLWEHSSATERLNNAWQAAQDDWPAEETLGEGRPLYRIHPLENRTVTLILPAAQLLRSGWPSDRRWRPARHSSGRAGGAPRARALLRSAR
jgi:hypothetical protein